MENPPELWYKDEGGRDKCISLDVSLRNAQGALMTGVELPLKCVLRYFNGAKQKVTNQKILKIQMESRNSISATSGDASLKLRIEEVRFMYAFTVLFSPCTVFYQVSKNHQNQSFCIEVTPDMNKDKSGQGAATASAFSGPISVKSKRVKKRQRVDDGMGPAAPSVRFFTFPFSVFPAPYC